MNKISYNMVAAQDKNNEMVVRITIGTRTIAKVTDQDTELFDEGYKLPISVINEARELVDYGNRALGILSAKKACDDLLSLL